MYPYDDPAFFDAYGQMPRSQQGLEGAGEWHQLQPLFPNLEGKSVLDLGCGYGWHCRYAAQQGAAWVLGIDQSQRMIQRARSMGDSPVIEYRVQDLLDYDYPQGQFDLALSNLALHYVQDLDGVYRRVYRTLRPGGIFLVNIEHPTFTSGVGQRWVTEGERLLYWPVDDYFYPGQRVTDFLGHPVVKYHHTLTQIVNGLLEAGFVLETLEEAVPPEAWRSQMPEEMRRPMMLLLRGRKPEGR